MKKALDSLIEKRKDTYVLEGFVATVHRDDASTITAADVSFGGVTRRIPTTLQTLIVNDLVEIQVPLGDIRRATIVGRSQVVGDFDHFTVSAGDG